MLVSSWASINGSEGVLADHKDEFNRRLDMSQSVGDICSNLQSNSRTFEHGALFTRRS
jgi:hypothetical protein